MGGRRWLTLWGALGYLVWGYGWYRVPLDRGSAPDPEQEGG
jgi:hypothetical protein